MPYEILNRETIVTETVYTKVQFDFLPEPILIPHVNPKSEQDIITGIENREISELRNLENNV